jgi:hypothetical protein
MSGWFIVELAITYWSMAYVGAHNAVRFSADVESFMVPNAASIWSIVLPRSVRWTGNEFETSCYVGYVASGLFVWAVITRPRRVGAFAALAMTGILLSMGPLLHVGGTVYPVHLPMAWLTRVIPAIRQSGLPVRFSWLATFGVAACAAISLESLNAGTRPRRLAAWILVVVAMIEVWPRPWPTTRWPAPAVFESWAMDKREWAVLDATYPSRALWNQTLHHHPIIGGYATRVPLDVFNKLRRDPTLASLFRSKYGISSQPRDVSSDVAVRDLRRLRVAFVIVDEAMSNVAERCGLVQVLRDDGVVIYSVP